jgi:hypothetical protein
MTCDDVQCLQGPYLDSELDARTTLEVEHHLKGCPDCARAFAEEEWVEAWLKAGLNRGERTPGLWKQVEGKISIRGQPRSQMFSSPAGPVNLFVVLLGQLKDSWSASRWIWTGLAATWAVILMLNTTARETDQAAGTRRPAPSTLDLRFALKQKQLWMVELAAPSGATSASSSKMAPVGPRSERHLVNLNS